MGTGYVFKCEKCGCDVHTMYGSGFFHPIYYEETVEKMKKGEYGEQAKMFFDEHPDGAIDCEYTGAVCKGCGRIDTVMKLDRYVPKENSRGDGCSSALSPEDVQYVDWLELKENYILYEKHVHRCEICKGVMESIDCKTLYEEKSAGRLKCPKCKEYLVGGSTLITRWD